MEETLAKIDSLLDQLAPITLEEMKVIKLMNRIDKKYMIHIDQLPVLLEMAKNDYYVQETGAKRRFLYRSCYYDTHDDKMYNMHCDGKLTRQKIRVREYVYSNLTFLEIKSKNNKGRTSKVRMEVPDTDILHQDEAKNYVCTKSHYLDSEIRPRLKNQFFRVTLVNKGKTERLTIDVNIEFENCLDGTRNGNPKLCIIELKRDGNVPSPFLRYFAKLRIKPKGISKYCYGMMLTDSKLKRNRFKPKLRFIEKLTGAYGLCALTAEPDIQ
ncbi:MAG: polyphosphate polymerase domain-containing protein [Bacteroidales bacterium]|nr:polyphosphate polymerase domain-containing protein [Candidatus Physcocola equi]